MDSASAEWQRMLAGELYDPTDPPLVQARTRAQQLCRQYNSIDPALFSERKQLLKELLPSFGERSEIVAPFQCDYGCHIRIGEGVYLNFGVVILDCAWITIGDRVLIGPGVQIYGASHPLDATIRATGRELAKPISIGDDTWIGGGGILCPGVTIGSGTTIGAGSVVTRDIPSNVFAAGNPCKVIRQLSIGSVSSNTVTIPVK